MSTNDETELHSPVRLQVLADTGLMDSGPELEFDRLTELASRFLHAPVALVSLVDERRQYFKSCFGLPEPWNTRRQTPLTHSFCRLAVISKRPLVISDSHADPQVCDNLAVPDLGVRAYLGVPIQDPNGAILGSFCVIDTEPRNWSEEDLDTVEKLCRCVETEIELRRRLGRSRKQIQRLKKSQKGLEQQAEVAVNLSTQKSLFLAKLSHEMRNPLTPILSTAELLHEGAVEDGKRPGLYEILLDEAKHLRRLVDDIQDVGRIERGVLSIDRQVVDLADVIRRAVRSAEPQVTTSRHSLTTRFETDDAFVMGDASRLLQVVSNLLTNACRYTAAGGSIEVTCREINSELEVRVKDDGAGIRPERLESVVGVFSQSGDETVTEREGLGLGLAIVSQLVELHGGRLEIQSDGPGCGTEVSVKLPRLSEVDRNVELTSPPSQSPAAAAQLDVIVVEDLPSIAYMLTTMLESMGHSVRQAESVDEADEMVAAKLPSVILSDIEMPGRSGLELARQMRGNERTKGIPLIAVTGRVMAGDREEIAAAGFDTCLAKPVDIAELRSVLAEIDS